MPDQPDPPRRHYTLKPREFEQVNSPTSPAAPTIHEILAANLKKQIPHEAPLDPHDRRTRRARDYWITMATGNIIGLFLTWPLINEIGLRAFISPFHLGFFTLFNTGLLWIMFVVKGKH